MSLLATLLSKFINAFSGYRAFAVCIILFILPHIIWAMLNFLYPRYSATFLVRCLAEGNIFVLLGVAIVSWQCRYYILRKQYNVLHQDNARGLVEATRIISAYQKDAETRLKNEKEALDMGCQYKEKRTEVIELSHERKRLSQRREVGAMLTYYIRTFYMLDMVTVGLEKLKTDFKCTPMGKSRTKILNDLMRIVKNMHISRPSKSRSPKGSKPIVEGSEDKLDEMETLIEEVEEDLRIASQAEVTDAYDVRNHGNDKLGEEDLGVKQLQNKLDG